MALVRSIPEVNKIIDNLVRNDFGTITSTLTKRFGPESIDQVENIVTKSLKEAKDIWSYSSVPNNPKNILWQFITGNSSDLFCKKILNHKYPLSKFNSSSNAVNLNYPDEDEAVENKIAMLFACCHPIASEDNRIALVLKILGGYSTSYIARILSKNENAVASELRETKNKIIDRKILLVIPKKFKLKERLDLVLETLNTLFELGFNHPDNKLTILPELCNTTINLTKVLTLHPRTNSPETQSLIALILLKGSRLNSMLDTKGNVLTLKEQDRSLWNKQMIKDGIHHLYLSASGENVTRIHLNAGIAAIHSTSNDYKSTNWQQIILLYDNYLKLNPSPYTELERSIAVSKAYGPYEGIKSIKKIDGLETLTSHDLLYSTIGNLYLQIHNYGKALSNFRKALTLSKKPADKSFLQNKIRICDQRIKMTNRYKYGLSF